MKQIIKITEDSFFKGTYSGYGDIELYGNFQGSLYVQNLYVKKSGVFTGYLSATNIIVEGEINADIQTENLDHYSQFVDMDKLRALTWTGIP